MTFFTFIFIGFLPTEIIELRKHHVDVNPEYTDSLDPELFMVHVMFGTTIDPNIINYTDSPILKSKILMQQQYKNSGIINSEDNEKSDMILPKYYQPGRAAFEAGLDEVS